MGPDVIAGFSLLTAAIVFVAVNVWYWPRDHDGTVAASMHRDGREFYARGYEQEDELRYQKVAEEAANTSDIFGSLTDFVARFDLQAARVLDIGAGRGYLQDVVPHYTGLDLSSTAKRFFHKPFVEGSACALPFADNQFHAVWSVWTLEHVPEPEKALCEIRRVLKPGGYAFLLPAWNVDPWAPQGYRVRPYADFDWKGKIVKASVFVQDSWPLKAAYVPVRRLMRLVSRTLFNRPLVLRFSRMTPNYSRYWTTDSDAVVRIDWYEAALWFTSRGDKCLNGLGVRDLVRSMSTRPLIIQVREDRSVGRV